MHLIRHYVTALAVDQSIAFNGYMDHSTPVVRAPYRFDASA